MPSQNKTKNLKLNQWQENEYPKMVDFNDDNQKIDVAFGNIEQKVTEGVENLDVAEKQVEFEEAATRTLPKTGDTLKVIVAKLTKYLKDLKTVAFTGKYTDLTGLPTSFPPAAHNHDDRYLGKLAKAESAKRADIATTAEQVQGFQFRKQNSKLEVLVEGEWIPVGGRQYTEIKKGDRYSGGPGIIRGIFVNALYLHEIEIDGKKVSMTYHRSSPETWHRHASSFNNIEFKNSFVLTFRGENYSGIKEGYALYQTEK